MGTSREAERLDAAAVAERLEIAVATVHVHAHRARVRIARAQARREELELHRFILHEALPGPVPSDPPRGLYQVTGPGQGERVRLRGAVVTVDDLVSIRFPNQSLRSCYQDFVDSRGFGICHPCPDHMGV